MKFTTKLNSRDVTIEKDGYDIYSGDIEITWELEIEAREWGIKGLYCAVMDVQGGYEIGKIPDGLDSDIKMEWEEFVFDSREWEIDVELNFDEWNQFAPTDIIINFNENKIEIS